MKGETQNINKIRIQNQFGRVSQGESLILN